jgi:hypothetical protein
VALPASTLSRVCRSVSDFVSAGLDAANHDIHVTVGSPGGASLPQTVDYHRVNLFFYRIDPFGFDNDGSPGETEWIRLHCLVTAFGLLEDNISVGENDLRLLGEVMRLFHESPVLAPLELDGETIQLQVVLQPLGTDDINHIWSTQGEIAYRTSVAYEMAVLPIIPKERAISGPLVGTIGTEVRGAMRRQGPFSGSTFVPQPRPIAVNTESESWVPHIAFLYAEAFAYSLTFAVGGEELVAFAPAVLILGEPNAAVSLRWDRWSSATGWEPVPGPGTDATPTGRTLDPDDVDVHTIDVDLPFDGAPVAGQLALYAVRQYARAADDAVITVRSNPLLITLFEPAA